MDAKFVDVRPPRLGRDVQKSLRDFCRTRWVRPRTLLRKNKKPQDGAFYFYRWRRGWDYSRCALTPLGPPCGRHPRFVAVKVD
jgi:hypothetical protein